MGKEHNIMFEELNHTPFTGFTGHFFWIYKLLPFLLLMSLKTFGLTPLNSLTSTSAEELLGLRLQNLVYFLVGLCQFVPALPYQLLRSF